MPMSMMLPSLFLFTLLAVLAIAFTAYALFLRKRENRHPVEKPELAGRTMAPSEPEPSQASPERRGLRQQELS